MGFLAMRNPAARYCPHTLFRRHFPAPSPFPSMSLVCCEGLGVVSMFFLGVVGGGVFGPVSRCLRRCTDDLKEKCGGP